MKIITNADIHNRFDIEIRDAKSGELKQKAQAQNIILNALWTQVIQNYGQYFNYISLGTGAGTLSTSRTDLFAPLVRKIKVDDGYTEDYATGIFSARAHITLAETENNGAVLTEVGIAYGNSANNLVTHAMLKDMNGNPVSITKTDLDIVTVYATTYCRLSAAGWDGGHFRIFKTDGQLTVPVTVALGIAPISSIGDLYFGRQRSHVTTKVAMQYAAFSGTITRSNDLANKKISVYRRLAVGDLNTDGIRSAAFYMLWYDLMGSTAFPGSPIAGEAIGTGDGSTVDFKTAFSHVKSGAKIYVDGVEQTTGVTVDLDKPASNDLALECIQLSGTNAWSHIGSTQNSGTASQMVIFENPYYASYGIDSIYAAAGPISTSDDGITWAVAATSTHGTTAIPGAHRNKRYWKFVNTSGYQQLYSFLSNDLAAAVKNIHFATAPASGAVITADYTTALVAKDVNHVFDLTLTFQFGEYIP